MPYLSVRYFRCNLTNLNYVYFIVAMASHTPSKSKVRCLRPTKPYPGIKYNRRLRGCVYELNCALVLYVRCITLGTWLPNFRYVLT